MGHVIAFFSKLDAGIQKRFDSVCFFLMRRFGVRKSSLRYVVNAMIIGAFAGNLATQMRYGLASAFGILMGGIFILVMPLGQHFDAIADREAEASPDTASRADRYADSGVWKIMAFIFCVTSGLELAYPPSMFTKVGLTEGQHLFPTFCDVLFWFFYLAWMYIRKTPMNPPPEKARESILTPQPAPAKT